MGSGTKNRKNSDRILIKRPKALLPTGAGGSASGDPADVCIPSFEVKVQKGTLTLGGVPVRLKAGIPRYTMLIGTTEIGTLSPELSEVVKKCSGWGINYAGKIVIKNTTPYARFIRIPG